VHDILTAAGGGANKDYPTKDGGAILGDLLGDHPSEREPKHIAGG